MKNSKVEFLAKVADYLIDSYCFICPDVARFISCQFALESDFGKSQIAKDNCNYCGMKLPVRRLTFARGENREHAVFGSFYDCIDDYVLWLTFNHFSMISMNNLELFKKTLKSSGYCSSLIYISSIQSIYNQYYSSKN